MTAPNVRSSAEGALGNHEKRISILEAAPPAAAAPASQLLFPTNVPRMPILSNTTGHRRWPGGVVVVSAFPYVSNGTTANNTNQNSFWYDGTNFKIVKHTQALDASTDGVSTISFTVGDVGLIPYVDYEAIICWRYPAAGAGFQARAYVSRTNPSGWASLGSAGTNVAATYFGMMRGGDVSWTSSADTVDVKIGYKTSGGSGEVQMDYIVFVPYSTFTQASIPTPRPTPAIPASFIGGDYRVMAGTNGPTEAYVGVDVHAPFSQDSYTDTQSCYDVLDSTNFNFTFGSIGLQSAYDYARMSGSTTPGMTTYPRHLYVPARLRPVASSDSAINDGLWDSQSFVTVLENGMPTDTAPIISCSWQLLYLGCHYFDNPNSLAVALWTPPEEATNARSPFEFSDPTFFDGPLIDGSIYGASSYFDQIDWTE